ncbi:uncharacterized protein LOC116660893 isoform X1 [Camelus ferus]|uniref:Uncharacterized protein LOC116660893 isoform X1 n=1 Tax=Camelus ferus TaxID=419612 RepID=A0A8B8SC10_CAMFR|nr:uncharacterized protein LOC116660893 isoform X1 [Camelus ferus]
MVELSQDADTGLSDSKAHIPDCRTGLPAAAALPGSPMHTPLRRGPPGLLVPVGPDLSTSILLTSGGAATDLEPWRNHFPPPGLITAWDSPCCPGTSVASASLAKTQPALQGSGMMGVTGRQKKGLLPSVRTPVVLDGRTPLLLRDLIITCILITSTKTVFPNEVAVQGPELRASTLSFGTKFNLQKAGVRGVQTEQWPFVKSLLLIVWKLHVEGKTQV